MVLTCLGMENRLLYSSSSSPASSFQMGDFIGEYKDPLGLRPNRPIESYDEVETHPLLLTPGSCLFPEALGHMNQLWFHVDGCICDKRKFWSTSPKPGVPQSRPTPVCDSQQMAQLRFGKWSYYFLSAAFLCEIRPLTELCLILAILGKGLSFHPSLQRMNQILDMTQIIMLLLS